ncbi:hypothetical protein Glove_410g110 [Diversispora epigaea]|uniref:SWIM-type domain-containing protein n=1 Tax=Diversispora epigaea TaxID=1348612 RepID=A0A397H375_9GLOM|nr:hypothetical protein Glove_410g110 [Diversispora epigaea]
MDIPTETYNASPSNSYGTNMDTINTPSIMTLQKGSSKEKIKATSEVAEGSGEVSTLGKRKAVAVENEDGSSTANRKRKAAKKRKRNEKRAARHIIDCSNFTKRRIERAMNEPMYMIGYEEINQTHRKYSVLGPTGEVYTTDIKKILSCTCPDFQKGFHCKHILFILLRILNADPNSDLIYQKALKEKELKLIFNNSPNITIPSDGIVEQLKAIASKDQRNRRLIDGNCTCCFEPLGNQKVLIWCKSCGNNLHLDCFTEWEKSLDPKQKNRLLA